jgi:hypothetical protein
MVADHGGGDRRTLNQPSTLNQIRVARLTTVQKANLYTCREDEVTSMMQKPLLSVESAHDGTSVIRAA